MITNRKPTGTACSMPAGLILGAVLSLSVTLFGAAITAYLIERGLLAPENTGYAIMVLLTVSAWAGSNLAYRKTHRRKLLICMLSGLVYFGIMLTITALFFGAQYQGVGETGLMILCGCSLEILIPKPGKRSTPQRKFRIRNG